MMPMTDEVHVAEPQRQQRADAGRRQGREDRQRVDEAFIEHAEDDVDDHQRGRDQRRRARERSLERLGVALERRDDLRAACRARRAAWVMASTASPSATPGRRLNVSVTAGNWPWWVTDSGPARLGIDLDQGRERHRRRR